MANASASNLLTDCADTWSERRNRCLNVITGFVRILLRKDTRLAGEGTVLVTSADAVHLAAAICRVLKSDRFLSQDAAKDTDAVRAAIEVAIFSGAPKACHASRLMDSRQLPNQILNTLQESGYIRVDTQSQPLAGIELRGVYRGYFIEPYREWAWTEPNGLIVLEQDYRNLPIGPPWSQLPMIGIYDRLCKIADMEEQLLYLEKQLSAADSYPLRNEIARRREAQKNVARDLIPSRQKLTDHRKFTDQSSAS